MSDDKKQDGEPATKAHDQRPYHALHNTPEMLESWAGIIETAREQARNGDKSAQRVVQQWDNKVKMATRKRPE